MYVHSNLLAKRTVKIVKCDKLKSNSSNKCTGKRKYFDRRQREKAIKTFICCGILCGMCTNTILIAGSNIHAHTFKSPQSTSIRKHVHSIYV